MGEGKRFRRGRRRTIDGIQAGGKAKRKRAPGASPTSRSLSLEALEDRRMLATFTVTNLFDLDIDDNVTAGSLCAAIENANDEDDADIIVFADGLVGTVLLNGGQLDIEQPVRILGPSAQKIAIQAQANRRIFNIEIDDDDELRNVDIAGLTLTGGSATTGGADTRFGGAIWNRENLTLYEMVFTVNAAGRGGGAIFHQFGNLSVNRSFFGASGFFALGNSAGAGGAIMVGDDDDTDNVPFATVVNSTFTGNAAGGNGGALYLRHGTLNIANSTIVGNTAGGYGAGVASYGNPLPTFDDGMYEDVPGDNTTRVTSSIIFGNLAAGMNDLLGVAGDLDLVGTGEVTVGDDDVDAPLVPSIVSGGSNIIGTSNLPLIVMPPLDMVPVPWGVTPFLMTDQLGVDPMLEPFAALHGGTTPVFLPQAGSPAIDKGDGANVPIFSYFDQRGRHFTREFGGGVDVGAAEVQNGMFIVDLIADETDLQYSTVDTLGFFGPDPYTFGDFALREALEFSESNPEVDTILFADFRGDVLNPDPTATPAPTIRLTLGELRVISPVFITGPNYILEVDASGNDLTPLVDDNKGTRVFNVDNLLPADFIAVTISNLTIMGGDILGSAGGILNKENLTLSAVTLRDNYATLNGGGVFHQLGTLTVLNSTIEGNRAAADGGGLFLSPVGGSPTAIVSNSTFSGNIAQARGGAMVNNGGTLTIEYSTITKNVAASLVGDGVVNIGAAAATSIKSSIVSANGTSDVYFLSGATINGYTSQGYNFVGTGPAIGKFVQTGDKISSNPLLAPLGITGGLVATHRPLPGSPVIDAGKPSDLAGNPAPLTDERGGSFVRVYDGDLNGSTIIDIGAYELQPTILIVDSPLDTSDGDFSTGNFTLREAIEVSNQNPLLDTIMFDPLLTVITVGGSLAPTLSITDSVHIIGTGSSQLSVQLSPVTPDQMILADKIFTVDNNSASLLDVDISGMELRFAQIGAILSRENLILDDITFFGNKSTTSGGAVFHEIGSFKITNSLATGNGTNTVGADGGAFYFRDVNGAAKIEFQDVTIAGNNTSQTTADGGALFIKNSKFEGRGVTISGNATLGGAADGGGVYVDGSNLLFEESVISGNSTVGANSEGAGLFLAGASSVVTLTKNSTLSLNSTIGSQSPGGGAFVLAGTLNVENSIVALNSTSGLTSPGGGIAAIGGVVNVTGTRVMQNRATGIGGNGGGFSVVNANLFVRDSTIANNLVTNANSKGGGVYSDTNLAGSQITSIVNSTVSGNSAPLRGGGVFNADGRLEIRHSTVTNNSTPFFNTGTGVASQANSSTLTVVQSSIVAGNAGAAAGTSSDIDSVDGTSTNSVQSLGFNVIGTGNPVGLGVFTQTGDKTGITNPLLGPLAFNGGLTETHALLAGSAAINSGNAAFNPGGFSPALTTDQRGAGFARVQAGRIDVGAFESSFSPFSADFDVDGRVDGADFLRWQRNVGVNGNATKGQGDANLDLKVDSTDLGILKSQFGASTSEAAVAPSVVSGGAELAAAVVADFSATAASSKRASAASHDAVSVASAGAPDNSSRRQSHRSAPQRRAAFDAAHGQSQTARRWTDAVRDVEKTKFAADGTAADVASRPDDELSCEDAAFAMLGADEF